MMRWAAEREAAVLTLSMNAGREAFYTGTIVVGPLARSFAGKREGGGGAIPSLQISDARIAGHVAISHDAGDIAGRFELPFESVKEVPFTSTGVAETPQATVLLAYAAALTRLDMAAAQAHSTSALEQEFLAARQELGEKFVRQMIAERYGDVASLERELRSAAASFRQAGDMAQIRVSRLPPGGGPADGRTQTFTFVRVDGEWKVR
jgi:hypothetical protein